MHEPISEYLEQYLAERGKLPANAEEHLAGCLECQEELAAMKAQSVLMQSLRAPRDVEPRAGFYARVMEQIEARRAKATFWSGFLEPAFAKRLAFASLTLVLLLGSVLAVIQNDRVSEDMAVSAHPEMVMVPQATPASATDSPDQERDATLVNLTTYSSGPQQAGGPIQ